MLAKLSQKEIERLQSLGRQIREIAELDQQKETKKLWTAMNDGKMIRPMVLVSPLPVFLLQDGTDEMTPMIQDPYWQRKEMEMLLTIYQWKHLRNDRVVEPYINVDAVIHDTGIGLPDAGQGGIWSKADDVAHSYAFKDLLTVDDDLTERLKMPEVSFDKEATAERYDRMCEIMDGIIDVKTRGATSFHFELGDDILSWMTLDEGMLALFTDMDFMKAAAKRYVECYCHRARQYEDLGLLTSNNNNEFIGQGGYGYCSDLPAPTKSGMGCKLSDMWGEMKDQILTSVSPAFTKEFAFDNEVPWTSLFGRFYYGCCERMDQKIDEIGVLPNLRKLSISPYTLQREAMEKIGDKYIISFKNNSLYLTNPEVNWDFLRQEMINVCKWAHEYNCNVEIMMKSIITLRNDPKRLWDWCSMAQEIVNSVW